MDDERLNNLLRRLDVPAEPDAGFGDELFVRLRTEAAGSPGHRSPVLVLVAAALLLVVALAAGLAVGAGILRLPWLISDASPTPTGSPIAEASASPTVSPAASGTPQATASADPAEAGISPGGLVETLVDGLSIRADPGTDAERLGSLALASVSYVVGGPADASGYQWYLVGALGLPPATGCGPDSGDTDPYDCPIWFGWVAGADEAGAPWLAAYSIECPEPPTELQELTLARAPLELLHCYGDPGRWQPEPRPGQDLVFRAWWPSERHSGASCESSPEIAWLRCPQVVLGWDPGYYEAVFVAVDPDAGLDLEQAILPEAAPEPGTQEPEGQWLEVTAHLDDPAANDCGNADATNEDLQAILTCRATLVVTRAEPTSAP
jgi:hypothetical protein